MRQLLCYNSFINCTENLCEAHFGERQCVSDVLPETHISEPLEMCSKFSAQKQNCYIAVFGVNSMTCEIKFIPCEWDKIHPLVAEYVIGNNITVDSFWEDHVLKSKHYKMMYQDVMAGYFAIHKGSTIVLFNVFPLYANQAQELFARVKKYESVKNAMVVTGDEFFISHCFDNFSRIEKQAYFSIYTDKKIPKGRQLEIGLKLADIDKDHDILKLSGDFFDGIITEIRDGCDHLEVYIAEHNGNIVGFGVIDWGRVIKDIASIGMYVCEQYRRQGLGANLLQALKQLSVDKGYRVFSGCGYYNHNSKKTMESAGAYSKTRLMRFYF